MSANYSSSLIQFPVSSQNITFSCKTVFQEVKAFHQGQKAGKQTVSECLLSKQFRKKFCTDTFAFIAGFFESSAQFRSIRLSKNRRQLFKFPSEKAPVLLTLFKNARFNVTAKLSNKFEKVTHKNMRWSFERCAKAQRWQKSKRPAPKLRTESVQGTNTDWPALGSWTSCYLVAECMQWHLPIAFSLISRLPSDWAFPYLHLKSLWSGFVLKPWNQWDMAPLYHHANTCHGRLSHGYQEVFPAQSIDLDPALFHRIHWLGSQWVEHWLRNISPTFLFQSKIVQRRSLAVGNVASVLSKRHLFKTEISKCTTFEISIHSLKVQVSNVQILG